MEKLLFVDTETTGLPVCMHAGVRMANNWPDVVQLAFCVDDGPIQCRYLNTPKSIEPGASKVHGITKEFLLEKGLDPRATLQEFLDECATCTHLVAHNIAFDRRVLLSQIMRLDLDPTPLLALEQICTMRKACNRVRAKPRRVSGKIVYKMPRLEECAKFFNVRANGNYHNAITDVDLLRKIYYKLQ